MTKRLVFRVKKLEKFNLQANYIVRILGRLMAAAVPHNIVDSFENAGISLVPVDNRVMQCLIIPETTQCLLGASFADHFAGPPLADEEDEYNDPNIEIFAARVLERLRHEGDEANEVDAPERVSLEGYHVRGA
jgi:hypothetical protein